MQVFSAPRLMRCLAVALLAAGCGDPNSNGDDVPHTTDDILASDVATADAVLPDSTSDVIGTPDGDASHSEDALPQGDLAADVAGDLEADATPDQVAADSNAEDLGSDSATFPDSPLDIGPASLGLLSPVELAEALPTKDFLLINVHVPYAGEIAGTDKNITYEDIDAIAAFIGSDLDTKVVVYCWSNYMSNIAGSALVERGYRTVSYLDGGMSAWLDAGYSLEQN